MVETLPNFWTLTAATALAAWVYLLAFHGRFWRSRPRLALPPQAPAEDRSRGEDRSPASAPASALAPAVVAVLPARNESQVIARSLGSVLAQDYPGPFFVVLVDDGSDDDTIAIARRTARELGQGRRLEVITAPPLPGGWAGKMWAVSQGVQQARHSHGEAVYLWLTDADVDHHRGELRALVAKAEAQGLDLVSVMVRLRCTAFWERLLIPAFVFFFQMLFPFSRVNDRQRRTAAAAGGSMLVRASALKRAGGIEDIRGALIDDCALARNIKAGGPIWLGLIEETRSIRPYDRLGEIWDMVARSAYTQLHHAPLILAAALAGMVLIYLAPPVIAVVGAFIGEPVAAGLGLLAWILMAAAYMPTLRLYGQPAPLAFLLPAVSLLYCLMTVDSAWRHWRGAGGRWKGRVYTPSGTSPDMFSDTPSGSASGTPCGPKTGPEAS